MNKRFKWVEIGVLVLLGLSPLVHASPKHEQPRGHGPNVVKVVKVEKRAPAIKHLPAAHQRVRYNHCDYYKAQGRWYKPSAGRYVMVAAPYGVTLRQLPHGAQPVWVRGVKYHQVAGTYYQWHAKQGYYRVVQAPRG